MTKIGAQQGEFIGKNPNGATEQVSLGSKNRFETSLKRSASNTGERLITPEPIGVGTLGNKQTSSAPPTYDLTQSVDFDEASQFIINGAGHEAAELGALREGLSSSTMPSIAVIGAADGGGVGPIVSLGRTIFIPAPTFAAWNDTGTADSLSATQFNQAFSKILINIGSYNS